MKAVNLIPGDARRGAMRSGGMPGGPAIAVLGVLALAVVLMTLYVLAGNSISSRKSKLAELQTEVAQAKARSAALNNYVQFGQLAQARLSTVRQIASSRFDWYAALSDLSKVVPANTSLQTLDGSVAPGLSAGGASGASSLRSDISAPAFELSGCTKTQDDVARLMSRLRLINGVTRVTLADSQKAAGATPGAAVSTSGTGPSSAGGQALGCGANAPTFDLVIFFQPIPGASTTTGGASGSQPVSTSSGASTTASTTTTTTSTTAQPVSGTAPASSGGTP
jgi:Tfp pilus assembly protein PilN